MIEYPMPINAEITKQFKTWFAGLPAGKYRASDLRKSFNRLLASNGMPSPISPTVFTRSFVSLGGKKSRDMVGSILEKLELVQHEEI